MSALRSIEHQTLAGKIAEALMDAMLGGEIHMGDRLQTEALAAQFGVSRMPIREALRSLEEAGLVEAIPYVGYRVALLSPENIQELYIIRGALEPVAARYACERATDAEIEAAAGIEAKLRAVCDEHKPEGRAIAELNRRFHFAMYEPAQLPQLITTLRRVWDQLAFCKLTYSLRYTVDREGTLVMRQEHEEMMAAFRARDGGRLAELLTTSIARHTVSVPATFEGDAPAHGVG